jgi:hypothetical protein
MIAGTLGAPHDAIMDDAPHFDAVLELATPVTNPDELPEATDLLPLVEGFAERCADWVDAERSAAVLGDEYVVVDGDEPVKLAFALWRRPSLTREQFQDYWLHRHTLIGQRRQPDLGNYTQVHAGADLSAQAAKVAGVSSAAFEGVALASWRDEDTFNTFMGRTEIVNGFLEDEQKFIDHARSAMIIGPSVEPAAPVAS